MRVVVGQFKQETNVFSPVRCDMDMFRSTYIYEGDECIHQLKDSRSEMGGIITALMEQKADIIPAVAMRAQSSAPVDRSVCDWFIERLLETIRDYSPIDGVFLSLHGATQLTDDDDGAGLILEAVRKAVGKDVIISASTDFHANITKKMIYNADVICGFHTYPHVDFFETGYRAAKLGLANGQLVAAIQMSGKTAKLMS